LVLSFWFSGACLGKLFFVDFGAFWFYNDASSKLTNYKVGGRVMKSFFVDFGSIFSFFCLLSLALTGPRAFIIFAVFYVFLVVVCVLCYQVLAMEFENSLSTDFYLRMETIFFLSKLFFVLAVFLFPFVGLILKAEKLWLTKKVWRLRWRAEIAEWLVDKGGIFFQMHDIEDRLIAFVEKDKSEAARLRSFVIEWSKEAFRNEAEELIKDNGWEIFPDETLGFVCFSQYDEGYQKHIKGLHVAAKAKESGELDDDGQRGKEPPEDDLGETDLEDGEPKVQVDFVVDKQGVATDLGKDAEPDPGDESLDDPESDFDSDKDLDPGDLESGEEGIIELTAVVADDSPEEPIKKVDFFVELEGQSILDGVAGVSFGVKEFSAIEWLAIPYNEGKGKYFEALIKKLGSKGEEVKALLKEKTKPGTGHRPQNGIEVTGLRVVIGSDGREKNVRLLVVFSGMVAVTFGEIEEHRIEGVV